MTTTLTTTEAGAWWDGRLSAYRRQPETACPFIQAGPLRAAWLAGYRAHRALLGLPDGHPEGGTAM